MFWPLQTVFSLIYYHFFWMKKYTPSNDAIAVLFVLLCYFVLQSSCHILVVPKNRQEQTWPRWHLGTSLLAWRETNYQQQPICDSLNHVRFSFKSYPLNKDFQVDRVRKIKFRCAPHPTLLKNQNFPFYTPHSNNYSPSNVRFVWNGEGDKGS